MTILVLAFRIELPNADISLVTLLKPGSNIDALPAISKILTGKFAVGSLFSWAVGECIGKLESF